MIHKYGYDDGRRGFEAKFWLDGRTLKVKVYGSDHGYDWWVNLKAWPRRKGFHRGWYREADKLFSHIDKVISHLRYREVIIIGHSAGGAIGAILPYFFPAGKVRTVITVNAPRFGNRKRVAQVAEILISMVHRGDIVRAWPFLYARPELVKYGDRTWFWRAHNNFPGVWDNF